MLSLNIKSVTKDLPEEIQKKTGYQKGIYLISDKTGQQSGVECFDNEQNDCNGNVQIFEMRIIAVLNEEQNETSLEELDPAIIDILKTTNQKICLCTKHLIEAIGNDNLDEKAVTISTI